MRLSVAGQILPRFGRAVQLVRQSDERVQFSLGLPGPDARGSQVHASSVRCQEEPAESRSIPPESDAMFPSVGRLERVPARVSHSPAERFPRSRLSKLYRNLYLYVTFNFQTFKAEKAKEEDVDGVPLESEDLDGAPLSDSEDLDGVPLDGAALLRSAEKLKPIQPRAPPRHFASSSKPKKQDQDIDGSPSKSLLLIVRLYVLK